MRKNPVQPIGESLGIVIGSESNLTKEVTMSKNFPAHVRSSKEDNAPVEIRTLVVRGVELTFREFASGYVSVGRTDAKVASKAMLDTSGKIRGFLGALATYIGKPEGTFERGFHAAEGIDKVLKTWDELKNGKKPVVRTYVHWKYLKDAEKLSLLKSNGIEHEDEGNYWVTVGAKRNGLYRMYVNRPQKWAEFEAEMVAEFGEIDWKSPEGETLKDERYTKKWGIQNRHDGFEALLRLMDGEIFVGMEYTPANETDARYFSKMMVDHYNGLWDLTTEQRDEAAEAARKAGEAARKLRGTVVAAALNPEFKHSDYAQAALDKGKAVIYKGEGETQKVSVKSLVGQRITFVYADGSSANDATLFIKTDAHVPAALNMASNLRALIALA